MPAARPSVPWLVPLFLLLSACGADEPESGGSETPSAAAEGTPGNSKGLDARRVQDTATAAEHIAMLVPADTAVYVQLKSIATFDNMIARLARANVELGPSFDELGRALHRRLPGDSRYLESDRPVGLALSLPPDRDPILTLVLPVKDVVLYRRSLQISPQGPQPVFDGTYLAISDDRSYERPRAPVSLACGDSEASVVARADIAKLDRRFGSQFRLALAALATGETSKSLGLPGDPRWIAMIQELADPLLYTLAVGQSAEVTCEIRADRIQLDASLHTRDAGVLAAWTQAPAVDLAPLSRSLVASDTFSFLGGADPTVLAEQLARALTTTDAERERLSKLLSSFTELFGPAAAVSASLSNGESHVALHVAAGADPAFGRNLASTFELFSRSGLGVAVQSKSSTTIEGVEVEDLLVRFDAPSMCALTGERPEDLVAVQARLDGVASTLFGAENVRVRIACFESVALIAVGNDDPWFRRTLLWAKEGRDLSPPEVRAALEHLGQAPAAAVMRLDLARWGQDEADWRAQWSALSEPVRNLSAPGEAAMHAVDPVPLTVHLGAEGRTLRIGVSMGLEMGAAGRSTRR
jgi:hypothetical protein